MMEKFPLFTPLFTQSSHAHFTVEFVIHYYYIFNRLIVDISAPDTV